MREEDKIRRYLDRAFGGVPQTDKVREEKEALLAELLEKYQQLVGNGYEPEAAYQSVISGIGDIFELVDAIAEDAGVKGVPAQEEFPGEGSGQGDGAGNWGKSWSPSSRFMEWMPYGAAGILFLFWLMGQIFPVGPKEREILPLLVLGAAAGAAVLYLLLRYPRPSAKRRIPAVHIAVAVVWCAGAFLFFRAVRTPRMEKIVWLIPIGALALTQLIFTWQLFEDSKKRGDLHE